MEIKSDNIIFCLKASNVEGSGASASSIMSAMTPEYIPGLFSFSVIVVLLGIDTTQEHQFAAHLIDPSENTISNVEGALGSVVDQNNLPDEYKGLNVTIDLTNINFKMSGLYKFEVIVDGNKVGSKEIYVKGKNE